MTPSQPKTDATPKSDKSNLTSAVPSGDLPPARPTPMTIAAARALVRRHAEVCGTNAEDEWFVYGEDFTHDAEAALNAAGVPALLASHQRLAEALGSIAQMSRQAKKGPAHVAKLTLDMMAGVAEDALASIPKEPT